MNSLNLEKIVLFIVSESVKLKNKYTDEIHAKVEFGDIFAKDITEYQQLTNTIGELGTIIYAGPTGDIYSLKKPIQTVAGNLQFIKIRKPDDKIHLRGDADFNTNYVRLKQKYQKHPNFELIVREKFEMLRLSDPNFDVMTCFSNIPVRKWI